MTLAYGSNENGTPPHTEIIGKWICYGMVMPLFPCSNIAGMNSLFYVSGGVFDCTGRECQINPLLFLELSSFKPLLKWR